MLDPALKGDREERLCMSEASRERRITGEQRAPERGCVHGVSGVQKLEAACGQRETGAGHAIVETKEEAIAYATLEMLTAMVNVAGDVPVDGSIEDTRTLRAA